MAWADPWANISLFAQVAGVVAMLLQQRPGSGAADIKKYLQAAAVGKTITSGSPG